MLIHTLTKKEVPFNKLPSDIGIIVNNVHTALSTYRAVVLSEPCIKRVITVSGRGVAVQGNYLVRTGTSIYDIFEVLGGAKYEPQKLEDYRKYAKERFMVCEEVANKMHAEKDEIKKKALKLELKKEIKLTNKDIFSHFEIATEGYNDCLVKIINGGAFMGTEISMEYCIEKRTSAILFLSEKEVDNDVILPCINCKKCARVCPVNIMPMKIFENLEVNNIKECSALNVQACIECGACSYVCPAKIPLVYAMRKAKAEVKKL